MGQTNPSLENSVDTGRLQRRAQARERDAERQADVEYAAIQQRRSAAANAHYNRVTVRTLPPPLEDIPFERAIEGIANHGWRWSLALDRTSAPGQWKALGGKGENVPVIFRRDDRIVIDSTRLSAEQQRRLDQLLMTHLRQPTHMSIGDQQVDPGTRTQPGAPVQGPPGSDSRH
jgi:hypothetical protein